jgi:DNA-binding NtrC family response regulator
LFYRLNVFPISLPALRDRTGDIPLLVKFLVGKFALRTGQRIASVGQETMARLTKYHWPGNVRELENILERAVILCSGETLEIDSELFAGTPANAAGEDLVPALGLEAVERNHILGILKLTNWVIEGEQGAAKLLDMHPNTLRSRLKKMGLRRETAHEAS